MQRRSVLAMMGAGLALALVGGCAARGPVAVDALALAPPLPSDHARLIFYTPPAFATIFTGESRVFVNRRRVGRMVRNGVFLADVLPGRQIITTSAEQGNALVIAVERGQTAYIELSDGTGDGADYLMQVVVPRHVPEDEGRAAMTGKRMIDAHY